LLIAFAFGAFVEGASGFGTPVAVAAAMLSGLGFSPFQAAAICLIANTSPVAFGAIGTPLVTLAAVTNLPLAELSAHVGKICAPVSLFVPAYLMLVMGGVKALRAVLPAALVCGISFAATQFLVSTYIGPYLTDILASLAIGVFETVGSTWVGDAWASAALYVVVLAVLSLRPLIFPGRRIPCPPPAGTGVT